MNTTFLQIFLLINMFIAGALAATAIRHAYAHFKPHKEAEKPPRPTAQVVHLPQEIKERLIKSSEAHFQTILNNSAEALQHDLKVTTAQLNKQLEKLGTDIAVHEMKRYHENLEQLRQQTESSISDAQLEITKHQAEIKAKLSERQTELEAKLNEEILAEKKIRLQQIDTKLADAVSSFIVETLQHNVDLGAQGEYLTTMLEEHKAELIKEINNEN